MFQDTFIDGVQYRIYYPEGIDPNNIPADTQVALYMHGGGNTIGDTNDAMNYLNNAYNNTKSIIMMPNASNRTTEEYFNDVVNSYDNFISEKNINQNKLVVSGYSSGYYSTFGVLDTYLEKHPSSDPANVYLVETYPQKGETRYNYNYDLYKDNQTAFISYTGRYGEERHYHSLGTTYSSILDLLTDNGCNVLNVLEPGRVGHWGAEEAFFKDGFIDFLNDNTNVDLTDASFTDAAHNYNSWAHAGYLYESRNLETGSWEKIGVENINTLDKLYSYLGIDVGPLTERIYKGNLRYLKEALSNNAINVSNIDIKSDLGILISNVNNVLSKVKNTTIVSSEVSLTAGSSTTKVPTQIPEIVSSYCMAASTLLCGLVATLKQMEEGGIALDEGEKEIAREAETVNDEDDTTLVSKLAGTGAGVDLIDKVVETDKSIKDDDIDGNNKDLITKNVMDDQPAIEKDDNGQESEKSKEIPKTDNPEKKKKWNPVKDSPREETNTITNWKEEFPEYNELYSTNDKVVFDYNNEFKVILHRDGETITGIEYYYDFGNSENAANALFNLKSMYGNSGIENIMMKDRYVKVIFNDSTFNNLSVSEFKNKYNDLKEIIRV